MAQPAQAPDDDSPRQGCHLDNANAPFPELLQPDLPGRQLAPPGPAREGIKHKSETIKDNIQISALSNYITVYHLQSSGQSLSYLLLLLTRKTMSAFNTVSACAIKLMSNTPGVPQGKICK